MKVGASALDEKDRLTSKELPLLDDDEWVEVRARRDFIRDASAETKSLVRVRVNRAFASNDLLDDDERAAEFDNPDGDTTLQIDAGWNLVNQFEYMCLDWNIYDPPNAAGERVPWEKTRQNREKFVRLHGAALFAQMLIRGGGIAPTAKLEGKVDADGTPLTFQEDGDVPAGGRKRGAAVA